ncbi:MAG: spore cortex biosynthesis protein YabQ [Clostridia bacterium]|nr:spore cortex biosynthesis protein YabQ [Clostridia bacterium]
MGFTNVAQLRELFLSCGMGFLLGAYYDVFRILRHVLRPGVVHVFWQDILFFITAALMTFLFALAIADGALRVYLFAGLVAGFFAYRYTVGRAVVRLVAAIIALLSRLGRLLHTAIAVPSGALGGVYRKITKKVRKKLKKFEKGLETRDTVGV